jgi:hypothetical protein
MTQANEPASLPPPETSGGASSLQTKLAALIQELRRSCRSYGLESDDPFSPVMKALILVLEWLGAFVAELRKITIDYSNLILQRSQANKAADEAAAARLQTQMEAAKVKILYDFRADFGRDFDKLTAGRVRAEVRKIGLGAALVLVASIMMSLAIGYRWGHGNAELSIHETETRLQAAFQNGANGASTWLGLMTWNDIGYALHLCSTNPTLDISQHGRRACHVPLWIEPDQGAPDAVMDDLISRAQQAQEKAGQVEIEPLRPPKVTPQRPKSP